MIDWSVPRLIAHRGASKFAPENTLAALRKAHQMGATWVEFDVVLGSRGVPMVFHDALLDRTTSGRGRVAFSSYHIIKTLDAGSWFSPEFTDERVPSLVEWLECAAECGMGINLEIKPRRHQVQRIAKEVVMALARHWPHALPVPLISSQSKKVLHQVRCLAPDALIGYIADRWSDKIPPLLLKLNAASLHVHYLQLTKSRVAMLHDLNKKVLAYTVNDSKLAKSLFDMGVDAIFSDNPQLLTT